MAPRIPRVSAIMDAVPLAVRREASLANESGSQEFIPAID
jgi:hypothetical protein